MRNCKVVWAIVVLLCTLATAPAAHAVIATWSPVTLITNNTDIVNPAMVIEALNFGNAGGNTLVPVGADTVTFVPTNAPFGAPNTSSDPNYFLTTAGVDSNFESVMDSWAFSATGFGGASQTKTFSGLTAGETYNLQIFMSDDRADLRTWNTQLTIGGTSTTLYITNFESNFVTATLTLGGAETSFDVDMLGLTNGPGGPSFGGLDVVLVNAMVLTLAPEPVEEPPAAAVPEPAVASMIALAGLVMLRRGRRVH